MFSHFSSPSWSWPANVLYNSTLPSSFTSSTEVMSFLLDWWVDTWKILSECCSYILQPLIFLPPNLQKKNSVVLIIFYSYLKSEDSSWYAHCLCNWATAFHSVANCCKYNINVKIITVTNSVNSIMQTFVQWHMSTWDWSYMGWNLVEFLNI